MKNIRHLSGASILTFVLTVNSLAGEIHTGRAEQFPSSDFGQIAELAVFMLLNILTAY